MDVIKSKIKIINREVIHPVKIAVTKHFRIIACLTLLVCFVSGIVTACTEADKVNANIAKEADNFNVLRRFAVINTRTDKVEFELIGRFSIQTEQYPKIYVTVEKSDGEYLKHIIGLNENTFYIVEDIGGAQVSKYRYEINYIPEMIKPFEITQND